MVNGATVAVERFKDYGPNGLQVEGRREIACVASGVTASLAFIDQALRGLRLVSVGVILVAANADLNVSARVHNNGANASTLTLVGPGVTIGELSVVGARSVVVDDLRLAPSGSARIRLQSFSGSLSLRRAAGGTTNREE